MVEILAAGTGMHCDVAYKPRKIVIEMRVRFRLKPEAYPLGLVKQVVEEDAHWVAGNTAGALSDFRKKKPRKLRGFLLQVGVLWNRVWCPTSLRPRGPVCCAGCVL